MKTKDRSLRLLMSISLIMNLAFTSDRLAAQSSTKDSNRWQSPFSFIASELMSSEILSLKEGLTILTPNILPHEAKKIRKDVGRFRTYLDLFIHLYPKYKSHDSWEATRELIDDGYEIIGHFKDMFDILGLSKDEVSEDDYDLPLLKKRRMKVLIWKKRFEYYFSKEKNLMYLENPLLHTIQLRPTDELPKYYWRLVPSAPHPQATFSSQIRLLAWELFGVVQDTYPTLWGIDAILKEENIVKFHDFRKKLRSILNFSSLFPGIILASQSESAPYILLLEFTKKLGKLNDLVLGLHDLESDNDMDEELKDLEILRAKRHIEAYWFELQSWSLQNEISIQLSLVQNYFQAQSGE